MCGIIGYWNLENEALPILSGALKMLEYRGYDSFGFATSNNEKICIEKQTGKINKRKYKKIPGKIGIGHTRWATHGEATKKNSHPHKDCTDKLAVVHNGIIENFEEIKKGLLRRGHKFLSNTDTEVIPHLIEEKIKSGLNLKQAVMKVFKLIKGRNAFIVLNSKTNEMIAARNGSPLILGLKEKEVFIASDIPAFLDKTNKVIYLDDGQLVVVKDEKPKFYDMNTGERIIKRLIKINWNHEQAEKGSYDHFMLKEIIEQKNTIAAAVNQDEVQIMKVAKEINKAKGVFFIGCGTAAKVCHTAEYIFSKVVNKHINYIPASEFENYKYFLVPETLVIAVSQSGETADVLDALKVAKSRGSKIISILNVMGSSMSRISDHTFYINAGPEKAVASTKATTAQIAVVILLAYACLGKIKEGSRLLMELCGKINDMLNPRYEKHIKNLAKELNQKNIQDIFIIGRGINYPLSLESAIKIMEVSYIHAQGFAGGELKHGPIALIDKGTPVIVLVAEDDNKTKILNNAMEVKSRGAYVIGISSENNDVFDYWIKTPSINAIESSIINLIPIQLLSYYLGIFNGHNVDYPKNLAKSVTVN